MSLTYAQKMALGAKRATYRRRLQEVLDAQGLSGAALARQLGICLPDAVGTTAQPQSSGLAACPRGAGKIPL